MKKLIFIFACLWMTTGQAQTFQNEVLVAEGTVAPYNEIEIAYAIPSVNKDTIYINVDSDIGNGLEMILRLGWEEHPLEGVDTPIFQHINGWQMMIKMGVAPSYSSQKAKITKTKQ